MNIAKFTVKLNAKVKNRGVIDMLREQKKESYKILSQNQRR